MLQLRVFGDASEMGQVADRLGELPGSSHVLRTGDGGSGNALVTADLGDDAADAALDAVGRLGVPSENIVLLRVESVGPGARARPFGSVVWTDLATEAGKNARPLARYLIFIGVAGVIAAFGVIYQNAILIVGAMAVSPDMLPITATCTALVLRRWLLATRAFGTLIIGLGVGCMIAALISLVLNQLDLLPTGFNIDGGVVRGLATVNVSTIFVAGVAGVAGILALETRASAGVGVAISVTTIPASAYFGVAVGVGELSKALGALLVLGINVGMLILGGSSTLLLQRWRTRQRQR